MSDLTDHFSAAELGVLGCEDRLVENARQLATQILEPIRQHYGCPLHVHDGYRDPGHNSRVGGKPASWHLFDGGEAAADFDVSGQDLESVFAWVRLQSKLPFDKAILEHNSSGRPVCLHVQFDHTQKPRRQASLGSSGNAHDYVQVEVV